MEKFPFVPRVVGWELTRRCNMKCIHCGSSAGSPHPDELTVEEGLDLCGQLADLGCEILTLSGGEPLLHPAWDRYAESLSQRGVRTYLITNGFYLEENVQRLLSAGVRRIGVSLDGLEETHNFIRRNPESFRRAMAGARSALEAGISVGTVTHVSKKNIGELEEMYRVFSSSGLGFWQIQITFLSGRMLENRELACEPADMLSIADFIARKRKEKGMKVVAGDNFGYFSRLDIAEGEWKGCFAGRWLLGVDADGGVKGCLSLPREFVEDNIRRRPLREIWEDRNLFRFNRCFDPEELGEFCSGCDKKLLCRGGCSVTAYSATGSVFNNPYCLYRLEHEAS
jgi:radical SAM protein with 4Fe4S-binding SPASM domain